MYFLSLDRNHSQAVVSKVMKLFVLQNAENFSDRCGTSSF
jgi:hypothetical protein